MTAGEICRARREGRLNDLLGVGKYGSEPVPPVRDSQFIVGSKEEVDEWIRRRSIRLPLRDKSARNQRARTRAPRAARRKTPVASSGSSSSTTTSGPPGRPRPPDDDEDPEGSLVTCAAGGACVEPDRRFDPRKAGPGRQKRYHGPKCRKAAHLDRAVRERDYEILKRTARELVRRGEIEPEDAMALVICPTPRILEALAARSEAA
jgi:hypothetical protein